jgi:hypothetical protein
VRRFLGSLPAIVSALLLAAHFYRGGQVALAAACPVAAVLLAVRRPWAAIMCRALLLAGAAVWVVTAARLIEARRAFGEPYLRMALILGFVAAFTALAAWLVPGDGGDAGEPRRP